MTYHLSDTSKKHLDGVDPDCMRVIERALEITKVDFGIPKSGGLRTVEQQMALYSAGLSQLDGINRKSKHQSGKAFDVFAYVDDKASWDETHLLHVATAILAAASQLKVPLAWGGHWTSFVDMPHFEIRD